MASTTAVLTYSFTVNSVSVSVDTDVSISIRKRKEQVLFRTLSNRNNINLGYLISQSVSPQKNLSISDRSTFLTQNRFPSLVNYTKFTGSSFTIQVDKFLVTSTFTTETPTQPAKPLFFYHKLRYFNSDLDDFSDRDLLSLEFGDYLLKKKNVTEYTTDLSTGKIYNNLENTYNADTVDFDVTYLKYSVRITDSVTNAQTVNIYHELLDNHYVFTAASFDDIDEWGNIVAGHLVYLVTELPGGSRFEVKLPSVTTYAYKELSNSRIYVKSPDALNTKRPWYVKVTNGKFLTSLSTGNNTSANFRYYLPEFETQVFDPYPPYKQHAEQVAVWLYNNLIKIPTGIIWDGSNGFTVDVVVKDETNTVKYAYTNNASKIGTYYNSTILYTNGVLSADSLNGFIELADQVNDDYYIVVSYTAEEIDYEFTSVDFNPLSNADILKYRVVLYSIPESPRTGTLTDTLHYLLVDSIGTIVYSSQAENGSLLAPSTQRLRNEDFTLDGTPIHSLYYDRTSTASGLRATQSGFFSTFLDELSFVDKYTVESTLTMDAFFTASGLIGGTVGSGEMIQNIQDNPKFLILADIYVGEAVAPNDTTTVDIRTRGGGIKEELEEDAYEEQPESMWYWDHNSRLPYPGAMTFLAEVPRSLLTEFGGAYTIDQIRSIIERHSALGSYVAIRPYGPVDPVLTSGVGLSGMVNLGWPTYGDSFDYYIYYSQLRDSGFTRYNSSVITDNSLGNTQTMTGLNLLQDYYIYITAVDSNSYEYPSPVYRIRTTAS